MNNAEFINIKKAIPGLYNSRNESFYLENAENSDIMILTAKTDFKFFKLKCGDSMQIERVDIEYHLNHKLFSFNRKVNN